jgi:hypothetical protein
MIKSIHHTAISVGAMKRSIRFYRDILGMRLEWDLDPYPSRLELSKIVALKNLQVRVALLSGFEHRIEFSQCWVNMMINFGRGHKKGSNRLYYFPPQLGTRTC